MTSLNNAKQLKMILTRSFNGKPDDYKEWRHRVTVKAKWIGDIARKACEYGSEQLKAEFKDSFKSFLACYEKFGKLEKEWLDKTDVDNFEMTQEISNLGNKLSIVSNNLREYLKDDASKQIEKL